MRQIPGRNAERPALSRCGTGVSPVQPRARRPCHNGPRFLRSYFVGAAMLALCLGHGSQAAEPQKRYYAYPAVQDQYGVIAPWYKEQNGQCDFRVRIAGETIKRYPWAEPPKAPSPAPDYVYNGRWSIAADGTITIPELRDWDDGDLGQRAAYTLFALTDYYRYSGDPAAIAHLAVLADTLLKHCQTGADHPWPNFLISCPTKGKPYGQCDPHGMIQLDITAQVGLGLVQAYELAGNTRWLDAAQHWADLLAEKRNRDPHLPPWNRYANPQDVPWEDQQTGGVLLILRFFDELIRIGYTGSGNSIVEARDAGRDYLRNHLLARWTAQDVWGRHYWDWADPAQDEICTETVARYLMENPAVFPNWRNDVRNILSLFLTRASVSPNSNGDVYSGAWAYPEGPGCCGRSLWYAPLQLSPVFAQYGVLADSEWGRELARRQMILGTYDCHATGVVEDNIDGGQIVAGSWFKITHPMALTHVLRTMGWLPEPLGANRENHIMRSSAVVTHVVYGKGRIAYSTFDAPASTIDVLRLAFRPAAISADGESLAESPGLNANGYEVNELPNGDCIITIRHDGKRSIVVEGEDPQQVADEGQLVFTGDWGKQEHGDHFHGAARVASTAGAAACTFEGNQVRLIGAAGPAGGKADVYLDDVKQLAGIDCWNPDPLRQQVLYYTSGLANGRHTFKIVVRGEKNPLSTGSNVYLEAVQFSAATGKASFGEGGGPIDPQRWIFGYTGREDYLDSQGHTWRPATEVVIRLGPMVDPVATSWYTARRRLAVADTDDPELYRYGMHGKDFTAYFTVGPGTYHVRLKFMETRAVKPELRAVNVHINGKQVVSNMDIAATAGKVEQADVKKGAVNLPPGEGLNQAVDLVFNDLEPANGVIAVGFTGGGEGEAIVSAIEVGPGPGGEGAKPVALTQPAG